MSTPNKVFTKHQKRTIANFNPDEYITIFADASWCPDTKAMGWYGWCKCAAGRFTSEGNGTAKSSGEAELHGIVSMIKYVQERFAFQDKKVVIQCDCLEALQKLDINIMPGAASVKLKHVKGHQGNSNPRAAVNNLCDKKAYKQMDLMRSQLRG